jgi:hypothetical protein
MKKEQVAAMQLRMALNAIQELQGIIERDGYLALCRPKTSRLLEKAQQETLGAIETLDT